MWLAAAAMVYGAYRQMEAEEEYARDVEARSWKQKIIDEVAAGQVVASGQHAALEQTRQYDLMAKRALAVAAAGGHASDVDMLIADIKGEGVYRAGLAMYEAETQAEKMRYEGQLAYEAGKAEAKAARTRKEAIAIGTVSSMGNLYASTRR